MAPFAFIYSDGLHASISPNRAAVCGHDQRTGCFHTSQRATVPPDNPFGPTNPTWAYGLRNPFGIAVSYSGQSAATDDGATGDAGAPPTGYDSLIYARIFEYLEVFYNRQRVHSLLGYRSPTACEQVPASTWPFGPR
jgi:Glucose / Sorbosone dehydrogenase